MTDMAAKCTRGEDISEADAVSLKGGFGVLRIFVKRRRHVYRGYTENTDAQGLMRTKRVLYLPSVTAFPDVTYLQ